MEVPTLGSSSLLSDACGGKYSRRFLLDDVAVRAGRSSTDGNKTAMSYFPPPCGRPDFSVNAKLRLLTEKGVETWTSERKS